MRSLLVMCAVTLCCWAGASVAALEGKLLAPCCYQEPVGRHQSEVAVKMRLEIARLAAEGKTEAEIVDLYVQRHGAKVLAGFAPTPGWAQSLPWGLTAAGTAALAAWVWRKAGRRRL